MIASRVHDEKAPIEVKEEVPKKSFWSFLKRKKRKSVYSEQKENGNGCNLRKKTGRSQLQVYFIL